MSYQNGPRIVTNGLVLCLDAGNTKSYPGTGTAWTDLSGNGNNGTLTNGPTYSSANKGSIVFDGTNDYVLTNITKSTIPTTSDVTLCGWIYSTNNAAYDEWINLSNSNTYAPNYHNISLGKDLDNKFYFNNYDGTEHRSLSNTSLLNSWIYAVGIRNSNTNYLYINGTIQASPVAAGTPNINNAATLKLGIVLSFWSKGNISLVQIYNRALSASEVLQNYNATKGRYGL